MTRSLGRRIDVRQPAGAACRGAVRIMPGRPTPWRGRCLSLVAALACAGCRSDLSQQLLERELRMQEDQIYQLQDELEAKCARLERVAGENTSLRRQLGFADGDAPVPAARPGLSMPAGQPTLVPPPLPIPGGPTASGQPGRLPPPISIPGSPGGGAAPGGVGPPRLEGVPPLPTEPRLPGAAVPATEPVLPVAGTMPATTDVDPAARAIAPDGPPATGRRLSHEESLAESGKISHLVINQARTECFDGTGDGVSDGLAIVIEPRDDDERLVTAAGDVTISVVDDQGRPVARWDIPAQEAIARFRRTSRNRGLHFVLRWPAQPPQGAAVRLAVKLTSFEGASFETDCTVATRPGSDAGESRAIPAD